MPVKLFWWSPLLMALASCSVPYYWQAVGGQWDLLRKRTPIDELLADEHVDSTLRRQLEVVAEIRRFASAELDLPQNRSYTTYTELDRDYVVWNVVAAEEFSIEPVQSCFPFAGCVAYRGFFDRAAAEAYEARLTAAGLDTYSAGSTAYSTLGYFADPVLSTMLAGGEDYLAPVLFHELAHQKFYVKSDSELSEAFASAIEQYGTLRWLEAAENRDRLEAYRARLQTSRDFADLIERARVRLADIYGREIPADAKRAAKAAVFDLLHEEYASVKQRWGGANNYDAWMSKPGNNARLAAVATYRRWLPALTWRISAIGLEAFYTEIAELAELPREQREPVLEQWNSYSLTPVRLAPDIG